MGEVVFLHHSAAIPRLVDEFGGAVEDVAKYAIVDFVVHGIGLLKFEDEAIIEPQRAAQVVAERRGREASCLHELLYDEIVFGHGMA